MDFPDSLDSDEMEIACKEWRLAGWKVRSDFGESEPWLEVGCWRGEEGHFLIYDWWVTYGRVDGVWLLKDIGGDIEGLPERCYVALH